tara:strand:+ start:3652 stop:3804 length:153 start_codon:yes stop_codon:yes gene_type:complete
MIPILLATALSCEDAQDIIDNINKSKVSEKAELVEVIKINSPKECWDAND